MHDEFSYSRTSSLLDKAREERSAGHFDVARTALKAAQERYDYSTVRRGSKAANDAVAASVRAEFARE